SAGPAPARRRPPADAGRTPPRAAAARSACCSRPPPSSLKAPQVRRVETKARATLLDTCFEGWARRGAKRLQLVDVAHLAAGLGFALAVEVQAGLGLVRQPRPGLGLVAQQVQHLDAGDRGGGAQRPAGDGAAV